LKIQLQDEKPFETRTESGAGGTGADPMAFPHDWHRGVLTDFLDAIEKNRAPRVSGAEALKVHRFIDAMLHLSAA
jgi:predicted dehydrogenase